MKRFIVGSSLIAMFGLSVFAKPFVVDVEGSKVGFSIKHLKLIKVDGVFKTFSADIDYDSASKSLKVFDGNIKIASVDTADQKRDDHLRANDIFDAEKYPNMQFKMTKYEAGKIYGDLTIKDTTKPVVLESKEALKGKMLEIKAQTTVKRSDFGVVWESNLKDSLVADEVTIILELKADAK